MPGVGQTSDQVTATIQNATTPKITNIVTPLVAGAEFTHTFATNTKQFSIKIRTLDATINLALATGLTSITFFTIPKGTSFSELNLNLTGVTIFMEVDASEKVVEILEWS